MSHSEEIEEIILQMLSRCTKLWRISLNSRGEWRNNWLGAALRWQTTHFRILLLKGSWAKNGECNSSISLREEKTAKVIMKLVVFLWTIILERAVFIRRVRMWGGRFLHWSQKSYGLIFLQIPKLIFGNRSK